jgi:hypothetical protein
MAQNGVTLITSGDDDIAPLTIFRHPQPSAATLGPEGSVFDPSREQAWV